MSEEIEIEVEEVSTEEEVQEQEVENYQTQNLFEVKSWLGNFLELNEMTDSEEAKKVWNSLLERVEEGFPEELKLLVNKVIDCKGIVNSPIKYALIQNHLSIYLTGISNQIEKSFEEVKKKTKGKGFLVIYEDYQDNTISYFTFKSNSYVEFIRELIRSFTNCDARVRAILDLGKEYYLAPMGTKAINGFLEEEFDYYYFLNREEGGDVAVDKRKYAKNKVDKLGNFSKLSLVKCLISLKELSDLTDELGLNPLNKKVGAVIEGIAKATDITLEEGGTTPKVLFGCNYRELSKDQYNEYTQIKKLISRMKLSSTPVEEKVEESVINIEEVEESSEK